MKRRIIFTDLDGTLLDASRYSFADAKPALGAIAAGSVPLILCSSKTRAEMQVYREKLHNSHPFISENGGGIFIPHGYFSFSFEAEESHGFRLIALGRPYAEIRKSFARLREQTGAKVRGFADMTGEEVATLTGLALGEAVLARRRDFDEAFVFDGAEDENFLHAIEAAGLNWTKGRIFHLMGNHDKGRAVEILVTLYRRQYGDISSVALGDSLNDLPMLMAADQAVLVRHEDGSYEAGIDMPHLVRTQLPGPAGWNETLLQILSHGTGNAREFIGR